MNPEHAERFTPGMVAPCGLNCAVCKRALRREERCLGCRGPDGAKPEYCFSICTIWKCDKLLSSGWAFCDACPDYPCAQVLEKEARYAAKYVLTESPMGNLARIRAQGMEAFLFGERARWECPECGGTLCVHTGECADCGHIRRKP
ncbi:MAG TPA: DUF3795 domain-containing protein [Candidatus Limnocylindria bacterium]|nr:DUF3795 domain-containing protein [Candidatus Limnocylindria bacterium]